MPERAEETSEVELLLCCKSTVESEDLFFFCVGGTLGNLFATIPHWDFSRFGAWLLRHVPFKERWGLIQWTTLGAQLQGKNRWEIVEASEVLFT